MNVHTLPRRAEPTYSLDRGIVYGPVRSRRLGHSLGINLFPRGHKVCPFDCVYCEYGHTTDLTLEPDNPISHSHAPSTEAVLASVERALHTTPNLEFITFSGHGEPTLHPAFPASVDGVVALRDRFQPRARVAVLSCSGLVARPEVRAALTRVDDRIMKLDAGDQATFRALNRPADGLSFEAVIDGLASLPETIIQRIVIAGPASNDRGPAHATWIEAVRRIRPVAIQLYSVDRPTAESSVRKVCLEALRDLAVQVEAETGIRTQAF
jgi:wyosine [tRNA(Phe)-imidazoG37] synthetase (radical SAM superfamily)